MNVARPQGDALAHHPGPPSGALSWRRLTPLLWVCGGALLVLYLVLLDQGALSRTGDLVHEMAHHGRHLLGAPCH